MKYAFETFFPVILRKDKNKSCLEMVVIDLHPSAPCSLAFGGTSSPNFESISSIKSIIAARSGAPPTLPSILPSGACRLFRTPVSAAEYADFGTP